MNGSHIIKLLVAGLLVFSSCSSSKFNYQSAYKFSHYQYQKTTPAKAPAPVASLKPVQVPAQHMPSDQKLRELQQQQAEKAAGALAANYKTTSRAERKAMRKDIRQQFKKVRQNMKAAEKEARQQDVVFNKKMYIGLVVLLAGIVVAILASGEVGALAIIVGVALIAWGFIEQA